MKLFHLLRSSWQWIWSTPKSRNLLAIFDTRPDNWAEVFIWKNFSPVSKISVAKTEISATGLASPPSHMNSSKFLQSKKRWSEISKTKTAQLIEIISRGPMSGRDTELQAASSYLLTYKIWLIDLKTCCTHAILILAEMPNCKASI